MFSNDLNGQTLFSYNDLRSGRFLCHYKIPCFFVQCVIQFYEAETLPV